MNNKLIITILPNNIKSKIEDKLKQYQFNKHENNRTVISTQVYHIITYTPGLIPTIDILHYYKDYKVLVIILQKDQYTPEEGNAYNLIINMILKLELKMIILKESNQQKIDLLLNTKEEMPIFDEPPKSTPYWDDNNRLLHNREISKGHIFGSYIQPPPLLFGRDGINVFLGDMYRGYCAFLILGGPSFAKLDKTQLKKPGILTMGVNNSVKSFRPNLWASVDDPGNFIKSIWLDPTIMKFVPMQYPEKKIFDNEEWKESNIKVGDCPNVFYFRRNETFDAKQFLWENTINWGNAPNNGSGRSVMLVAIRLLWYLGIRTVFLLGCDLKMDTNYKYHFEQDRSKSSISGNNYTYKKLIERFRLLRPFFDKFGYNIYNCNPESKLDAFPFMSFDEAIEIAQVNMPRDTENERTLGLYDRQADEKKTKKPIEPEYFI